MARLQRDSKRRARRRMSDIDNHWTLFVDAVTQGNSSALRGAAWTRVVLDHKGKAFSAPLGVQ